MVMMEVHLLLLLKINYFNKVTVQLEYFDHLVFSILIVWCSDDSFMHFKSIKLSQPFSYNFIKNSNTTFQ